MNSKNFLILATLISIFMIGGVGAVECNADLSQGGNSCTVSSSLTLNGSYVVNINGSVNTASGAIVVSGSNLVFDCNNTLIYGNATKEVTNAYQGIYVSGDNVTIQNCRVSDYQKGMRFTAGADNCSSIGNNVSKTNFGIYYRTSLNSRSLNDLSTDNNYGIYSEIGANNLYILNFTSLNDGEGLVSYTNINLTFLNSSIYNSTSYQAIEISRSSFLVENNNINLVSKCGYFSNSTNWIVKNNVCNNSYLNYDGWSLGFYIDDIRNSPTTSQNINWTISNNLIHNYGCTGINARGFYNGTIINNDFSTNINSISCSYDIQSAIRLGEIYQGFIPTGTQSGDGFAQSSIHNSTLIYIAGNTFSSNVKVKLFLQGIYQVTLDISDYWLKSINLPYLAHPSYFYISNDFNNLSTITPAGNTSYVLQQGISGNMSLNYSFFRGNYDYYKNINTFPLVITGVSGVLTSALLTNGTSLCNGSSSNLAQNTGQVNITLNPNQFCYVLDSYNLTEGQNRENSPIWFSSSTSTEKHIASNVSDSVNVTIILNTINSCNINTLTH